MAETPTFGRYAEIPYDQMTPEQQDAYRSLIETRGRLPGPNKIWVHNPKLAKVMGPLGRVFPHRLFARASASARSRSSSSTASGIRSTRPTRMSAPARPPGCPPTRSRRCCRVCRPRSTTSASRSSTRWPICLSESRWVSKGLYDRAVKALGHVGITDVICLMGFYTSVSMTLAFYDVPAGAEGLQR